jgi:hypothetical protein
MRDYPFLLAYRGATHDTTGLTPAHLVFGLPCDLLFEAPPDKERPTTDYAEDIHNYAHQHLKLASDQMKTRYDKLANSAGYQEADRVWLYRPTHTKGKSPWEGPYKILTWTNDVVYRIQKNPRSKMTIVHLDRPTPYHGVTRDEHTRRKQW